MSARRRDDRQQTADGSGTSPRTFKYLEPESGLAKPVIDVVGVVLEAPGSVNCNPRQCEILQLGYLTRPIHHLYIY